MSEVTKVLIAEDDRASQDLYKRILPNGNIFIVGIANNGEEAINLYRFLGGEPDIIVMDNQMPIMNGMEATLAIRQAEETTDVRTPIIAMTAHTIEGFRDQCIENDMDGYISKPIRPDELFKTLEVTTARQS